MNKPKWIKFSEDLLKQIISESFSYREVAQKLGYSQNGGGAIKSIKNMCTKLNFDTSHFTGKGWNKKIYTLDDFTLNTYKKKGKTLREPLVEIRGHQCEKCKNTEWLGFPINLEVHHINGDRTDNRLENLSLLCPNCHSYMPTFSKIGEKREKTDEEFIQALKNNTSIRQALLQLDLTPRGANYERAWDLIYKYNIDHLKRDIKNKE